MKSKKCFLITLLFSAITGIAQAEETATASGQSGLAAPWSTPPHGSTADKCCEDEVCCIPVPQKAVHKAKQISKTYPSKGS